jgi:hypothetical protein
MLTVVTANQRQSRWHVCGNADGKQLLEKFHKRRPHFLVILGLLYNQVLAAASPVVESVLCFRGCPQNCDPIAELWIWTVCFSHNVIFWLGLLWFLSVSPGNYADSYFMMSRLPPSTCFLTHHSLTDLTVRRCTVWDNDKLLNRAMNQLTYIECLL